MSRDQSQLCCCRGRALNLQRISPLHDAQENCKLQEVRPKRWLNICHLNPRPRDDRFCRELHVASQHLANGYPVTRRAQVAPSPVHVSYNQHMPELPNTMGSNKPIHGGIKDSPHCPETQAHMEQHVISDKKTATHVNDTVLDTTVDRGHSAASVALSILSRQSCAPSPQAALTAERSAHSPFTQPQLNPQGPESQSDNQRTESNHPNSLSHCQNSQSAAKDAVLFFLHGVGGSADTWRSQLDYFSTQGYEVVAPDLIGHGFSMAPDKKKAYHFEEITKDLEAIFDKFCKRRNVIVAHSYGCSFAAVLARKRSRRVSKIVLISGGGPTPLAPQPGVFSLPFCLLLCVRPCLDCGFKKSAFHRSSRVHSPKEEAFDIPTYVLSHMMNGQQWLEGDKVFHNWLSVATLLIYGKHDKLVSLEEEKTMEETIYGSRLEVVEEASHMVMMERPDVVNSLIHNFLLSDLRIAGHHDQDKSS